MPTPKERYDNEIANINKSIEDSQYQDDEVEILEEADEMEIEADKESDKMIDEIKENKVLETKVIDKNLGNLSVPEKDFKDRNSSIKKQTIESFQALKEAAKEKLDKETRRKITIVLKAFSEGRISDPVLEHLIEQKMELNEKFEEKNLQVKKFNEVMMGKLVSLSKEAIDLKSKLDFVDLSLGKIITKNPDWQA